MKASKHMEGKKEYLKKAQDWFKRRLAFMPKEICKDIGKLGISSKHTEPHDEEKSVTAVITQPYIEEEPAQTLKTSALPHHARNSDLLVSISAALQMACNPSAPHETFDCILFDLGDSFPSSEDFASDIQPQLSAGES